MTTTGPDEDWHTLTLDGFELYAGHEVPVAIWLKLLRIAGARVEERCVSAHDLGTCALNCRECQQEETDGIGESD